MLGAAPLALPPSPKHKHGCLSGSPPPSAPTVAARLGPPLQANCPNCGEPNLNSYFGDILTVAGPRDKNTVKCPCCSSTLEFDAQKRAVSEHIQSCCFGCAVLGVSRCSGCVGVATPCGVAGRKHLCTPAGRSPDEQPVPAVGPSPWVAQQLRHLRPPSCRCWSARLRPPEAPAVHRCPSRHQRPPPLDGVAAPRHLLAQQKFSPPAACASHPGECIAAGSAEVCWSLLPIARSTPDGLMAAFAGCSPPLPPPPPPPHLCPSDCYCFLPWCCLATGTASAAPYVSHQPNDHSRLGKRPPLALPMLLAAPPRADPRQPGPLVYILPARLSRGHVTAALQAS
jgi:hypothetical protein